MSRILTTAIWCPAKLLERCGLVLIKRWWCTKVSEIYTVKSWPPVHIPILSFNKANAICLATVNGVSKLPFYLNQQEIQLVPSLMISLSLTLSMSLGPVQTLVPLLHIVLSLIFNLPTTAITCHAAGHRIISAFQISFGQHVLKLWLKKTHPLVICFWYLCSDNIDASCVGPMLCLWRQRRLIKARSCQCFCYQDRFRYRTRHLKKVCILYSVPSLVASVSPETGPARLLWPKDLTASQV